MLASRALHLVARVALRVQSPLAAKRTVDMAASFLPRVRGRAAALRVLRSVAGRGTCLTRSLVVASRVEDAEVVIGVSPTSRSIDAHAWVEIGGAPLADDDARGEVIARLTRKRRASTAASSSSNGVPSSPGPDHRGRIGT
jgi:hypothetical protein